MIASLAVLQTANLSTPVQAKSNDDRQALLRQLDELNEKTNAVTKILLEPSEADRQRYAAFLKRKGTGLIRLMPRDVYEKNLVIRGGGAYYSFISGSHEYGFGSDIEYANDTFSVGFNGRDWGAFLDLGKNVDLASLDMINCIPAKQLSQLSEESFRKQRLNDSKFDRHIKAVEGDTYVLRSVQERQSASLDSMVAFIPIRKDSDGSIVILWKMLPASNDRNALGENMLLAVTDAGTKDSMSSAPSHSRPSTETIITVTEPNKKSHVLKYGVAPSAQQVEALEIKKDYVMLYFVGRIFASNHRAVLAKEFFEKSLTCNPFEHPTSSNSSSRYVRYFACDDLGDFYMANGDGKHAILYFTQAINIDAGRSKIFEKRARAYQTSGDAKSAAKDLQMAESLRSKSKDKDWISKINFSVSISQRTGG